MRRRPLAAATLVVAACAAVFLPSSGAQGPGGHADEVARRLRRWETEPALQPFTAPAAAPAAASAAGPPPGAQWVSLHVGMNRLDPAKYPGVPDLEAAENDAEKLAALARLRGFDATVLRSQEATAERVLGILRHYTQTLRPGDLCLMTFAGHGGLIPDYNGSHAPRKTDQAFCLYDRMLVDDEAIALWPGFQPGVRVLIVLDSCHSGTNTVADAAYRKRKHKWIFPAGRPDPLAALTRGVPGAEPKFRGLRAVDTDGAVAAQEAELKRVTAELKVQEAITATRASVIRVAGCRSDQVSLEAGGYGLFTKTLLDIWDGGRFTGTYQEVVQEATRRLTPYQEPTVDLYGEEVQSFMGAASLGR